MRLRIAFSTLILVFACCGLGPPLLAQVPVAPKQLSALNQCASIDSSGFATIGIEVTGTWSATLQPQVSISGQTATNTTVVPEGSTSSSAQSTITANGTYSASVAARSLFQVCVTSYTSGTATVVLFGSDKINANLFGGGGGGGSGTVNNVATGGLATGGPITTSGTITVPASGTGTKAQSTNATTSTLGDVTTYDGSTNTQDSGTLLSSLAPKASPALTGIPTVPTAAPGTNTIQAASTAFVLANSSALPSGTQACDLWNTNGATVYSTNCPVYNSALAAGADPVARIQGLISNMAPNTSIVIDGRSDSGTWLAGPFEPLYGLGFNPSKTGILLLPCSVKTLVNRSIAVPSGWAVIPCGRQYGGTNSNIGTNLVANAGTFQATTTGTATNTAAIGGGNLTLSAAANASGGTTVYTGTITSGTSNAFAGANISISGFTNAVNNGIFPVTASSTSSITVSNPSGVAETHAGTLAVSYIFTVTGTGFTAANKGMYYGVCTSNSPATVSGTSCGATLGSNAQGLVVAVPNSTTLAIAARNPGSGTANASGVNYVMTNPLIQMGDSAGVSGNPFNYDMAIGTLDVAGTLDCAGVLGCIPIFNMSASNLASVGKWVIGVSDGPGLSLQGSQVQNSGPYGPFWVVPSTGASCTQTAMGAMFRANAAIPFNLMTGSSIAIASCGTTGTNEGIVIDGQVDIDGLHIGINTVAIASSAGIDIANGNNINGGAGCTPVCYAAPGSASGTRITNVNGFQLGTNLVNLGTNLTPANISINTLKLFSSGAWTNLLNDATRSCTIPYGAFVSGVTEPNLNYYNLNNPGDYLSSSTIPGCTGLHVAGTVTAGTGVVTGSGASAAGSATAIFASTEGSVAGTPTVNQDYFRADSTAHGYKLSLNNGAEFLSAMNFPLNGTGAKVQSTNMSGTTTNGGIVTTDAAGNTLANTTLLSSIPPSPTGSGILNVTSGAYNTPYATIGSGTKVQMATTQTGTGTIGVLATSPTLTNPTANGGTSSAASLFVSTNSTSAIGLIAQAGIASGALTNPLIASNDTSTATSVTPLGETEYTCTDTNLCSQWDDGTNPFMQVLKGTNTLNLIVGGGSTYKGGLELLATNGNGFILNPVASPTAIRTVTLPDNTGTVAELNLAQTFTAIPVFPNGTITNAELVNSSTTVNGQTCTLGSTCTITAAATSGTVTYTTSTAASSADNGLLVRMNCSSACAYTLPNPQPSTTFAVHVQSVGSTLATIALGSSMTYNGGASVPVLQTDTQISVSANTQTSTDYSGSLPLVAGTGISLTPSANGLTIANTGGALSGNQVTISGANSAAAWLTAGIGLTVVGSTYTDTSSTGTVAATAVHAFAVPTIAASSATTYTASSTVYIAGPPTSGTNVTQTNAYSLNVATGKALFSGTLLSPTLEAPGATSPLSVCGGICASNTTGITGLILAQGSDNGSGSASAVGGLAILRGGMLTAATPNAAALEGPPQVGSGFLKGTAIANVGDVICGTTTAFTVTDCALGASNIIGIATSTTNPIGVVSSGQSLVKLDAAVTAIGDNVCGPPTGTGTAGLGHDNGTTACVLGTAIGIIIADSGTIPVMSGSGTANVAMSTTLPLVQLHISQ
jgi:hypothetical protein